MYQGQLPKLTEGPFSLFYGGEQIIPDLSDQSPGLGLPVLVIGSAIFQSSLYIFKKVKSRRLNVYPQMLSRTLVENVLNMYSIMVIIITSIVSVSWALLHQWSMKYGVWSEKNKDSVRSKRLIPREIILFFIAVSTITALPFLKSYALR